MVLHNGNLPDSILAPVAGGRMRKDAAARFNVMNVALRARGQRTVVLNGSISGYRPFSAQVMLRQQWCARGACQNAAVPGSSNHGWGIAGDANWMSTSQAFVTINHYFDKSCSDAPWESWHRRACGLSASVFSGVPTPPRPRPIAYTKQEKLTIWRIHHARRKRSTRARRAYIRILKRRILALRKDIERAAHKDGWQKNDRKRRHDGLLKVYKGG
jgi:hypothetical protein